MHKPIRHSVEAFRRRPSTESIFPQTQTLRSESVGSRVWFASGTRRSPERLLKLSPKPHGGSRARRSADLLHGMTAYV